MAYTYGSVTNCKTYNGQTRSEYQCRLGYQVNSQDIASNTSNITLRLEVRSINSSYCTYGYNQTTTIDGTSLSAKSFDMRDTNTWQIFGTRTITVTHNNDGTYSASKSGSFTTTGNSTWNLKSGSASVTVAPATIPRYGTSNQSLNSKTETTIKMNWSSDSTVDYIWYSKDNGSSWTGVDVTDGTSGTYTISGLSPNTAYNIKTRIRRKDSQLTTDSSTLSVTTYKVPTNALSSKTETTITMSWSCDSTVDYIWASINGGSSWFAISSVNATSGTYTISGLSANTTYNVKTRCRRSATQTTYDTSTVSIATYNYPYCTSSPNFTIGNAVKLDFYNPLNRTISVKLIGNGDAILGSWSGTGTTITGFNDSGSVNTQYASIPNSQSATYKVQVTYASIVNTRNNGNTYSIKGSEVPSFSNFTYKDTNTTVTSITENDQVLVKGLSNLQVDITSANKMVPQNSATAKNYVLAIANLSKTVDYSTSDLNITMGTVTSSGTQRLNVRAYDYRNLSTLVYKDITVYDYSKPVINASITRLNNFEAQTTLKVSGTYTKLAINNVNKNTITNVQYRYRETGGTWSSWTTLTTTVNNGTFTCSDVILSLDNTKSFEFQIQATDKLQQTTTENGSIDIGEAIFFISTNNKACYINGQEIIMYDVVDEW